VLSDFGISHIDDEMFTSLDTVALAGNPRWTARELYFDANSPTKFSDLWSFGMLCLELFSGAVPFADVKEEKFVIMDVSMCNYPRRPLQLQSEQFEELWRRMKDCWSDDPADRPDALSMREVLLRASTVAN